MLASRQFLARSANQIPALVNHPGLVRRYERDINFGSNPGREIHGLDKRPRPVDQCRERYPPCSPKRRWRYLGVEAFAKDFSRMAVWNIQAAAQRSMTLGSTSCGGGRRGGQSQP